MIGPIMHDEEVFATKEVTCVGQVRSDMECNCLVQLHGAIAAASTQIPICAGAVIIPTQTKDITQALCDTFTFFCAHCVGHRRCGCGDGTARPPRCQGRSGDVRGFTGSDQH